MTETSTNDPNLQNVQDRLMKMLDSVRLDPNLPPEPPPPRQKNEPSESSQSASPTATQTTQDSDDACCPSCDSPEPWGESSWCPNCGYYPKLKQKIVRRDPDEFIDADQEDEELSVIGMVQIVPKWVFWLSSGLLLLLIESLAIRCLVLDIVTRSQIAILQILIGLNVFGIAHIRSYMIASHDNENLNLISIFWAPSAIWKTTIERMPSVSKTVCFGSWGLAAILFAVLFIGLDYDNLFRPENFRRDSPSNPLRLIVGTMTQAAKSKGASVGSGGNPSDSLEDALKDFAGDPGSSEESHSVETSTTSDQTFNDENSEDDPENGHVVIRSTVPLSGKKTHKKEYFVFGFLTNSTGELRSILLAEAIENNKGVRFSGKYNISLRDDPFLSKFRSSLNHHRTVRPAMKTIYNANWTAPALVCSIAHNGVTPDGRFRQGQIVSYYDQATPDLEKEQ